MKDIITPTDARKNLYSLIKSVNKNHTPITISSTKNNDNAILMSKEDYDAMMETMYLEANDVGKIVRQREKDNSGYTDVENIDWDNL